MRPTLVHCACGEPMKVGSRGRLPTTCRPCKLRDARGLTDHWNPIESEAERRAARPPIPRHPSVTGTGRARIRLHARRGSARLAA